MPKFSIVIPTYSNVDGLRQALESIVKYTDLKQAEVIVVANGAPDETKELLEFYRYYPIKLIWIPEPIGYTKATNVGLRAVHPDAQFVIPFNDDCLLLEQQQNFWLDLLVEPFSDPKMAITGPVLHRCEAANREFLIFFCVMIRKAVMDEIGILDEIFSPGSGEDTDWTCRAVDAGWKMQQVPPQPGFLVPQDSCPDLEGWQRMKMWSNNFPLYHHGNRTFSKIPHIYEPAMQKNHKILQERYNPQMIQTERAKSVEGWFAEDEIAWLGGQVKALPENAVIVEVGSWKGRSSRAIADNLPKGGKLYCVDTWNGSSGEPDAHLTAKEREGDNVFMSFFHALHDHVDAGRVVPVRMTSTNAAETLNNLRPDMIFIDGDHSEQGIRTDIDAWLPLLKEGGLICGHDYYKENEGPHWVHVRQTVEAHWPNVEKAATSIWHVRPHETVKRSHVYDCFLFHNELDVLEIRLATLHDVVDRFVLVEANQTHVGLPKPLYFNENKERFTKYLDKITHVIIDLPEVEGSIYDKAWRREEYQRDAVMHGLKDCADNDIIIIGDADEVAAPEVVANYDVSQGIVRLKQRMFYYYLNCENKEGWDWQKIAPYSEVKRLTPCGIRYPPSQAPLIENGGWHFSFCGDAAHISQKLSDYSHREYDTPEINNPDAIQRAMENAEDIFGRDLKYEFVEIDEDYPAYVRDHYQELIGKGLIRVEREAEQVATTVEPVIESLARKKHWSVTACVSTKDRYQTTLGLCLSALINQTHQPDKLKIYDDGEQRNLFELAPFDGLLKLAQDKGIDVEVLSTPRKGQVANHQHCLDNATTDFIWRVDDDEIPEPRCLEVLLDSVLDYGDGGQFDKIGAIGGLVHHPGAVSLLPQGVDGSLNDLSKGLNLAWFSWNGSIREADHLYSTFMYRTEMARQAGGYPTSLSTIGHREETIFSHSLKRAGYKVLVTPYTKTYHLRESSGGIRSFTDQTLWEHDEQVFQEYLRAWNVSLGTSKLAILDCGLGDTLLFKGCFSELQRRNPRKWVLAVCYPSVFEGMDDVTIISIADAKMLVGNKFDSYLLYKWMWDKDWKGSLVDAMMEYYG